VEGRLAPEIRASGGAVLRVGAGRLVDVLLVHRPGHRDWTLPKGKVEPGEADEDCALREVAEETGFECLLGPELGESRYRDRKGRPKGVRYWAMTVRAGAFQPNSEVDEIRWVPLPSAGRELSYPGDRAILDALEPALRPLVHGSLDVTEQGPSAVRDDRVSVAATFRADGAADVVTTLIAAFGGEAWEYDVREDSIDGEHDPYYWSDV